MKYRAVELLNRNYPGINARVGDCWSVYSCGGATAYEIRRGDTTYAVYFR